MGSGKSPLSRASCPERAHCSSQQARKELRGDSSNRRTSCRSSASCPAKSALASVAPSALVSTSCLRTVRMRVELPRSASSGSESLSLSELFRSTLIGLPLHERYPLSQL